MQENNIGGLVVVDDQQFVLGILTKRDIKFEDNEKLLVQDLMTPRSKLAVAPPKTNLDEARSILHRYKVEKLPLVTSDNKLAGLITAQDIVKTKQHPLASKDSKGRLIVGAAIGVTDGEFERSKALIDAGCDVLVLDIAHGHSENAINALKKVKQLGSHIKVIAGNVASAEGTRALCEAGADAIKVGIGPGSICTTRIVTGFGVPQLSAILECAEAARQYGIPVIADGGIRTSGDLTKAIAAGAQSVMIGSLFAGTQESPGKIIKRNGKKYKITRGMASLSANLSRKDDKYLADADYNEIVPEGVEAMVPYKGAVSEIITQLVGGLKSGMSYAGAHNIVELQKHAEFMQITSASMTESLPHDVNLL